MNNAIESLPLASLLPPPDLDQPLQVTFTLKSRDELEKLNAWMAGDTWEKAQAARRADLEQGVLSLQALLKTTRQHLGTSGGRVCATLLASLYNGERVKFDASDLRVLDQDLFEHAMNTMRLCHETHREPHQFFLNGGALFEEMIQTWGLEKKRRARQ